MAKIFDHNRLDALRRLEAEALAAIKRFNVALAGTGPITRRAGDFDEAYCLAPLVDRAPVVPQPAGKPAPKFRTAAQEREELAQVARRLGMSEERIAERFNVAVKPGSGKKIEKPPLVEFKLIF